MGMFDWLNCEYPLPVEDAPVTGWQTKDTPAQSIDTFTIREDGSLWGQEYDIEDHSDPNAEGMKSVIGRATRVNIRDVPSNMTGEIRFYTSKSEDSKRGWIEFSAYFKGGKIQQLELIENRDD